MSLIPIFTRKWNGWYRVLRYGNGFGLFDSVRDGLWLARGCAEAFVTARIQPANGPRDLLPQSAGRRASRSLLEIEAWTPSEIKAISPLVDRLMRLIEGSHCVVGEEPAV